MEEPCGLEASSTQAFQIKHRSSVSESLWASGFVSVRSGAAVAREAEPVEIVRPRMGYFSSTVSLLTSPEL